MQESNDNNITYNNIKNAKTFGVRIGASSGNMIDHNNIVGNDNGAVVVDCAANLTNNWWGSILVDLVGLGLAVVIALRLLTLRFIMTHGW